MNKQVSETSHVNLQHTHGQSELCRFVLRNLVKELFDCSRNNSLLPISSFLQISLFQQLASLRKDLYIFFIIIIEIRSIYHGVSFPSSSLAICQDANIVAIQRGSEDRTHFLEHII